MRRLYAPFVAPGDLVFDVGAHLGDRTAAFHALGADVIAIEPQPHIVPWLRRIVGGKPGVVIVAEALGRSPGRARLAMSDTTPTLSTISQTWPERIVRENPTFRDVRWDHWAEVSVTTLDALIEAYGAPRFCKIDVEGHEAEVLGGLSHPLDALSVEFVEGAFDVAVACVRRLESLGPYEFNAVIGEQRSFVFPDWIDGAALVEWLADGASGASSGDLYAQRSLTNP